jgi:hypothetical protein
MEARRVTWAECLLIGIGVFGVFGALGTVILLDVLINYLRTDTNLWEEIDPRIVACAAVAAAITGTVIWRVVVATTEAAPRRGARAGLLVGIVTHPLCSLGFSAYILARSPLPGRPPISSLIFSLVFTTTWLTVTSLGVLGWISAPLGALLGYLTVCLRAAIVPRSGGKPEQDRGSVDE